MAIQSLWQSVPAQIQAPNLNSSAALAINAWDQIGKGLSGLGETLIENPTSKMYLHDLNQGKDISGYNPLTLSRKVLEDTPATQNQLLQNKNQVLQNDAKALENAIAQANEDDLIKYRDLLNAAQLKYNQGDFVGAKQIYNDLINSGIRPNVVKPYIDNIDEQVRARESLALERDRNAQGWANINAEKAKEARKLDDELFKGKLIAWLNKHQTSSTPIDVATALDEFSKYHNLSNEDRYKAYRFAQDIINSQGYTHNYTNQNLLGNLINNPNKTNDTFTKFGVKEPEQLK